MASIGHWHHHGICTRLLPSSGCRCESQCTWHCSATAQSWKTGPVTGRKRTATAQTWANRHPSPRSAAMLFSCWSVKESRWWETLGGCQGGGWWLLQVQNSCWSCLTCSWSCSLWFWLGHRMPATRLCSRSHHPGDLPWLLWAEWPHLSPFPRKCGNFGNSFLGQYFRIDSFQEENGCCNKELAFHWGSVPSPFAVTHL